MKNKSGIAVLAFAALFVLSVFAFCEDKDEDSARAVSATVLKYTECQENAFFNRPTDEQLEERLEYSVKGHELYISRYNELYNCCDSVLTVDVVIEAGKIVVSERGDNVCDCICVRDAHYKISNIPTGHYIVEISGRDDTFEIDVRYVGRKYQQ